MRDFLANNRTKLLVIFGILTVGLVIFVLISRQNSPSRTVTHVDSDTGEVLINEPNKTPEQFNTTEEILLLGAPELMNRGLTQGQFDLFRENTIKYVHQNFNQYDRVKILPDELSGLGNEINGKLRLGESDNLLTFSLKVYDLKFIEINIHDSSNKAPDLNTGKLEAKTTSEEFEETEL